MGESQTPGMRLSVVIPCLNSADQLPVQLWALARERWQGRWEVVIADNGSTDGTREVAERFKDRLPRLLVVDASARRGASYARNVGARSASGEAFLFLDADDEIVPGYLPAMADALAHHDFVAAHRDSESLNTGWVRLSRRAHPCEGFRNFYGFLPHAGGTRIGVRRPIFESAGGFDERSEEHTSELQSLAYLVCRLLLEKKKKHNYRTISERDRLDEHLSHRPGHASRD